jgi:hypothetical protein
MRIAITLVVAAITAVNGIVTVRLWRSPLFDRGQKVAQTILLWVIPGTAAVVYGLLRSPERSPSNDPTVSNDAATDYSSFGSRTHGSSYPDGT